MTAWWEFKAKKDKNKLNQTNGSVKETGTFSGEGANKEVGDTEIGTLRDIFEDVNTSKELFNEFIDNNLDRFKEF